MNDHIRERHARPETGAERLQDRLLGGEPASQALNSIRPVANLIELSLDKAARDQRVAPILDPAPQLSDFHQIDAMSDDVHEGSRSLAVQPSR
jgi:hypothetical protein